jgi:hypothetical protein
MRRANSFLLALTAAASLALLAAGSASAAITTVANTPAGAGQVAAAMSGSGANVTAASFTMANPTAPANGVEDAPLGGLPTNGGTFGILTSGNVQLADDPNTSGSSGLGQGTGVHLRGNSDFDTTIFRIDLLAQANSNCLTFDFKFFSDEYPEYVGSAYNDAFIAELDASTWTTSGSTITAPNNFAFDPAGNVISINAAGVTSMTAANAAGTTYDGATPLLAASKQLTPGPHSLYLSIFDQGDAILDSAVFLDNLRVGFVPNPEVNCKPGAQLVNFQMTLTPPSATNPVGTQHTVTATLTGATGAPVAGAAIQFQVTGANTVAGVGVTNASGQAMFTYIGVNAGNDAISACYDQNADGSCEAVGLATKTWGVSDTTPPTCVIKQVVNGPPKQLIIKTQDTGSGLKSIVVNTTTNAVTPPPVFAPGEKGEVDVTSTKINESQSSVVKLTVTDVAGNVTVCDPVLATVAIHRAGQPSKQTYTHLARSESKVRLINGTPGIRTVAIRVNGHALKQIRLASSQTRIVNVARWMRRGNNNKITVVARGAVGTNATILISD